MKYKKPVSRDFGQLPEKVEGVCVNGSTARGTTGVDCAFGQVARGSMCFANGEEVSLACNMGFRPEMDCLTGGTDIQ
ncbi:MAG: hypothetical protein IT316_04440 [Anaerolineales bacterium]|nr:hypothetical protein [Anaerolineales bacterium]